MTLKEYLIDYAKDDTKQIGLDLIDEEIHNIPKEKVQKIVRERLKMIEDGNRDFRF
jgi:2-iminoacetate synthase